MVKAHHAMNGLMFGSSNRARSGFSIIEIMIALAIIGLALTVVVPRLRRSDNALLYDTVARIQGLVQTGYTHALTTGKIQRVFFDLERNRVRLEQAQGTYNAQGKLEFEAVKIPYARTDFELDARFELRSVVINGKDFISGAIGTTTNEVWFFIMPEGLAQEVTLVLYDTVQDVQKALVMNPFTAQLRVS